MRHAIIWANDGQISDTYMRHSGTMSQCRAKDV